MIVVTTPMCRQIVEWAGLDEFKVNKHPDKEEGDLAILLSESKVEMDSLAIKLNTFGQIKESIKIVSNCLFKKGLIDKAIGDDEIQSIFNDYKSQDLEYALLNKEEFDKIRESNKGKKVKVYSEFLKDIVRDIGATVIDFTYEKDESVDFQFNKDESADFKFNKDESVDFQFKNDSNNSENDFKYLVYPDYLEDQVLKREDVDSNDFKVIKILSHNNISKDPILKAESRYSILINGMKWFQSIKIIIK